MNIPNPNRFGRTEKWAMALWGALLVFTGFYNGTGWSELAPLVRILATVTGYCVFGYGAFVLLLRTHDWTSDAITWLVKAVEARKPVTDTGRRTPTPSELAEIDLDEPLTVAKLRAARIHQRISRSYVDRKLGHRYGTVAMVETLGLFTFEPDDMALWAQLIRDTPRGGPFYRAEDLLRSEWQQYLALAVALGAGGWYVFHNVLWPSLAVVVAALGAHLLRRMSETQYTFDEK